MKKPTSTEQLLVSLGWPGVHVNFTGEKTWLKIENEEATTGVLIVTDKVICARVRSQEEGHKICSIMEAIWNIESGAPNLKKYTWMNQNIEASQETIIRSFKEHIETIGNEHTTFNSKELRKKHSNMASLSTLETPFN